ncbi:hypothetical protein V7149_26195, partial [Bacillus sp. JJ1503]|uniref:hypothetical protein n=2 Tax=unclassified Bacillus (in: firmicutes) TaxID=185979 RepID=UPI002FFF1CA0
SQSIEGVGSYFAYIKLSEVQQKQGNLLKALDSSFSALEINKNFPPALSQYFFILKSAGINENDINENLKKSYPIFDVKGLEILVGVLYAHRNKLLQYYIDEYNIEVNNSVLAISALYNKKYEEASLIWEKENILDNNIFSDVFTLLMVQENEELLRKLLQSMNLNKKEKVELTSIVNKSDNKLISFSETIYDMIKNACINLLRVDEESVFLETYRKLNLNVQQKEQLISSLINNGYLKIAIDLLTDELNTNSKNYELIGLLADGYSRQNRFKEALDLYTQLIEKVGSYSSYNRLYNLYQKINYSDGLPLIETQMKIILENE